MLHVHVRLFGWVSPFILHSYFEPSARANLCSMDTAVFPIGTYGLTVEECKDSKSGSFICFCISFRYSDDTQLGSWGKSSQCPNYFRTQNQTYLIACIAVSAQRRQYRIGTVM